MGTGNKSRVIVLICSSRIFFTHISPSKNYNWFQYKHCHSYKPNTANTGFFLSHLMKERVHTLFSGNVIIGKLKSTPLFLVLIWKKPVATGMCCSEIEVGNSKLFKRVGMTSYKRYGSKTYCRGFQFHNTFLGLPLSLHQTSPIKEI